MTPRLYGPPAEADAPPILLEPSLFYDPPYERPLEDEFAWHLVKYLNPVTALGYQVKVETPCAPFWVDFVVEHGGRRIGFECGALGDEAGDEAGDDDEQHARFREALLVGSGGVDVLYRFRGPDLAYRLHDCLLAAARWDPALFSRRGHINLERLASPEACAHRPRRGDTVLRLAFERPAEDDLYDGEAFAWPAEARGQLVVRRVDRADPSAWVRDFDRALAHFGVPPGRLGRHWARAV